MKISLHLRKVWVLAVFTLFSCVTNKLVIENDPDNSSTVIAEIFEKIEVGDWISLKLNNKTYNRLQVVSMEGTKMKVRQHLYDNSTLYHDINLEYIQELKMVDLEATFPVGVPVTILLVIFYLLV